MPTHVDAMWMRPHASAAHTTPHLVAALPRRACACAHRCTPSQGQASPCTCLGSRRRWEGPGSGRPRPADSAASSPPPPPPPGTSARMHACAHYGVSHLAQVRARCRSEFRVAVLTDADRAAGAGVEGAAMAAGCRTTPGGAAGQASPAGHAACRGTIGKAAGR